MPRLVDTIQKRSLTVEQAVAALQNNDQQEIDASDQGSTADPSPFIPANTVCQTLKLHGNNFGAGSGPTKIVVAFGDSNNPQNPYNSNVQVLTLNNGIVTYVNLMLQMNNALLEFTGFIGNRDITILDTKLPQNRALAQQVHDVIVKTTFTTTDLTTFQGLLDQKPSLNGFYPPTDALNFTTSARNQLVHLAAERCHDLAVGELLSLSMS